MATTIETSRLAPWGITLLRVVTGVVFLMHGWQKVFVWGFGGVEQAFAGMGIPFAAASAVLVSLLELVGGALLLAGLFTRLVSVPLAVTMVVAVVVAHLSKGFFNPEGYEFPLLVLASSVALALNGAGAFALDNVLARRKASSAPLGASPRPVAA